MVIEPRQPLHQAYIADAQARVDDLGISVNA
jgi:hypothetical protein